MMKSPFPTLILQLAAAGIAVHADIVYITDLPNYSRLAGCAAYAVSNVLDYLTYSACPPAVTALESCACTKNNNVVEVASSISSMVLGNCDSTASEDVASASIVFENYCNQDKSMTPFATPEYPVTDYITAFPAYSDLAPCASQALSYAMASLTYSKCPEDVEDIASCACLKNQNSLLVSELINTSVENYCSTIKADVESAHAVFAGYCGLVNGTTAFPTTSELPGSLTYYITDMTEYSNLAGCAASAISNEMNYYVSYSYCPPGPGAVASCACDKPGVSAMISKDLISQVSNYCSESPEDKTSVLSVFDFYCSAARGSVKAEGITVAETTPTYGATGTGATKAPTSKSKSSIASKTGTGSSSASTSGSSTPGSDKSSEPKKSTIPLGGIIAAAVGGVVLIALILFVGWRYRRKHLAKPKPSTDPNIPPIYEGKAELASTSVAAVPPPTGSGYYDPSQHKPSPMPSPVPSAISPMQQEKPGVYSAPPPNFAEAPGAHMYNPPPPNFAEAPGGNPHAVPMQANYAQRGQWPAEMQGQQYAQYEMQGNPSQPRHEMGSGATANMNSGPVYEMPGQYGRAS